MILDHIENIELTEFTPLRTNLHSFYHLKEGIFMNYRSMLALEKSNFSGPIPSFRMNGCLTQQDAQAVCLMHWYSISLVNFVNSIGLILFFREHSVQPHEIANNQILKRRLKEIQKEYYLKIPEFQSVLHFRNKAAAHLAFSDPFICKNNDFDNASTLIESMSIVPTFENGRYYVGNLTRQSGECVSSFSQYPWSLTENFESLIERYFKSDFD